jgi:hypothetical protein
LSAVHGNCSRIISTNTSALQSIVLGKSQWHYFHNVREINQTLRVIGVKAESGTR